MMMLGATYTYKIATKYYRASAVVMLNNRQEQVLDIASVIGSLGSDSTDINTEVEVLRSRRLLGAVVDQVDLMNDPEFNSSLLPPSEFDLWKTKVKSVLGLSPVEIPLTAEEKLKIERDQTINALLDAVAVSNLPQSLVFRVNVETQNASKSAMLADTLVEVYIQNQVAVKFEATEQATEWLAGRVTELQSELELAEARLKEFRIETDLVSPDSLAVLELQLKDVRDRIQNLQQDRDEVVQKLSSLRAAERPEEQVNATDDLQLRRLLQRLDEPGAVSSFEDRVETLAQQYEAQINRILGQIQSLDAAQVELIATTDEQNADLITIQQLTREAEASRLLYEFFLTRLKETSAQQGLQQADSRIISDAIIPFAVSKPRKSIVLMMCGMVGFLMGAAILLLREARNDSFRTAEELENFTGLNVVGQLPLLPGRSRRDPLEYMLKNPTSPAAEAMRNLRTSITLSNPDTPPQVMLISSSLPGEGKSTVSISLAQSFAALGRRVLLIEGDIRRRTFRTYFNHDADYGVASVLNGSCKVEDAVHQSDKFGFDVLMADEVKINAADLYASNAFGDFIESLRGSYDHIVIDTPPVLIVPDARLLAQAADWFLFVVHWDVTLKSQVQEALARFSSLGLSPSGLALNKISETRMREYGYGHNAYGQYGGNYYKG